MANRSRNCAFRESDWDSRQPFQYIYISQDAASVNESMTCFLSVCYCGEDSKFYWSSGNIFHGSTTIDILLHP